MTPSAPKENGMLKLAGVGLTAVLVAGVMVTGCARRPAMSATAAPAPTGIGVNAAGGGAKAAASTIRPAAGTAQESRPAPSTAPLAGRPAVKDFTVVPDLVDIYFEFDKYDIGPADARALKSNARWLR